MLWLALGLAWVFGLQRLPLGVFWLIGGALQTSAAGLLLRGRVAVDAGHLHWRGSLRSQSIAWDDVARLIIDDRGDRWGSKVAITLVTRNRTRVEVPADALSGLERPANSDRRRRLLDAIVGCAEDAGVAVETPTPGDPLVA